MFRDLWKFPPEIIVMILTYLPAADLRTLMKVKSLIPYVLVIQKSRIKKYRKVGGYNPIVTEGLFENKINLELGEWRERCFSMNEDIVTINTTGNIKIYGAKEGNFQVKKKINPRIKITSPLILPLDVYVDEHRGVIVLRNLCRRRKDFGPSSRWELYFNITIVDTEKSIVIHKNLEHESTVDMNRCVAVLDDFVVIGETGGKVRLWDRASGQCMVVLNHSNFLRFLAAEQGFFVTVSSGMIKCWNEFEQDTTRLTRKEFKEKNEEWTWMPGVRERVALIKVDKDIIVIVLCGYLFSRTASKIVVLNRGGKMIRSISTTWYYNIFGISNQNTILSERILAMTLKNGQCQVWDLSTSNTILEIRHLSVTRHDTLGRNVVFSGQEGIMITCNRNDNLEAWDLISGKYLRELPSQHFLVRDENKITQIYLTKNKDLFAITHGGDLIKY